MSVVIECGLCPWSQEYRDQETAERKLATHRQARHGEGPLDTVTPIDGVTWRERAIEAVKILVARGEDFAMWEIHNFGVGEPPDPKHQWGRLSQDLHRLGIAHPVDHTLSARPGTKESSVRKWSGDKTRCERCARKASTA